MVPDVSEPNLTLNLTLTPQRGRGGCRPLQGSFTSSDLVRRPTRSQTPLLVKSTLCSSSLSTGEQWCSHPSLVHSADQITLSATTTVATETWRERLGVCVVLLGIGCRGRDAFQSNLLLGCVSAPPTPPREGRRERAAVGDCAILFWWCLNSLLLSDGRLTAELLRRLNYWEALIESGSSGESFSC